MKNNQPVTDNEVKLRDGQFIVSTTDLKGAITSANRDFVEISGFTESELLGKSHNIVRHPDMPSEAFQDLWNTLKADKPWAGMVKNRCKNGDYYWVWANVTPIRDAGHTRGYLSVRTRPTRRQIEAAEDLYSRVRSQETTLRPPVFPRFWTRSHSFGVGAYLTLLLTIQLLGMAAVAFTAYQGYPWSTVALVGGGAFLLLLTGMSLMGSRIRNVTKQLSRGLRMMASGEYFEWVATDHDDELGKVLQDFRSAQIRLASDVNDIRQKGAESLRIRQALDYTTANVMVADTNHKIIYTNQSVEKMLRDAEPDLRKELPEFDSRAILGQNIDVFHKNPEHQRALLAKLDSTYSADVTVGGRSLRIICTPIKEQDGTRLGTVVEWRDRTQEVAVEDEIQSVVNGALMGELSHRISMQGKDGFFKVLGGQVNELMDVNQRVIDDALQVLGNMADGDLTQSMIGEYQGAFGNLKRNINSVVAQLTEALIEIRTGADTVLHGSQEITMGNDDLARRTETQSSAVGEIASTMEEMASTVSQNAENARHSSELAQDARQKAERGGEVVGAAVSSMETIKQSSKEIAEITRVVDEIADQTNLLALNAAVEAARAGDQGRGFAVVAAEVRNLAQRSASAAKQINDLIGKSVKNVDEGALLVKNSGETLQEIIAAVRTVNDIIAEITAAGDEQSIGIAQVNRAIAHLDEMTQQNAALVEQASSASESMRDQADSLVDLVNKFDVSERGSTERRPTRSVPDERRSNDRPWSGPAPAPATAGGHGHLDFSAARTKHRSWKTRLRAFLDGRQSMSESETLSHHECELGKWIDQTGKNQFGHLDAMRQLDQMHADMHHSVKEVVRLKRAGDTEAAEAKYAEVGPMSEQVITKLNEVESLARGQKVSAAPQPKSPRVASGGSNESDWEEF